MIQKVACANGKDIKKTLKMRPKSIRNSMKINTKNMLEKRELKYENSSKKWSKNGAKIHQKSFQNRCEKRDKKKRFPPLARRNARGPQTQSFQKTLYEVNTRRKPTEGWVQGGVQKVECKRQVQKGKCRQGTHDAPKHARWPATTCGSLTRIPPGQGLGLLRLRNRGNNNKQSIPSRWTSTKIYFQLVRHLQTNEKSM